MEGLPRPDHLRDDIQRSSSAREARKDRKQALQIHAEIEETSRWPIYQNNFLAYITYFEKRLPGAKRIPENIKRWKQKNDGPALVLDIAGFANGRSIGADITVNLNLMPPAGVALESEDQIIVVGDITETSRRQRCSSGILRPSTR